MTVNTPAAMLTVRQVAEQLAISHGAVYSLCYAGKLRFYRVGAKSGRYRFHQHDVDEYLAGSASAAIPQAPPAKPRRTGAAPKATIEPILLRQAGWRG